MITIEQCRGARGLLGWTQQDLADSSGLSKTAINNFEKGHSDIKYESLKAIRMAFESAGIEFIGLEGIQKRTEDLQIFKGASAFSDLLDDMYETLSDTGGEILISNIDERTTNQATPKKLLEHLERLKQKNIRERVLCPEATVSVLSSTELCRWTPKESFEMGMPTFIYGSKVAFELWDQSMIIVIDSRETSDSMRRRFEGLWASAIVPPEKNNATNPSKVRGT